MSMTQRRTIIEKTAGYGIGAILCIAGGLILIWTAWKTWGHMQEGVAFLDALMKQASSISLAGYQVNLAFMHYAIIGSAVLVVGCVLLAVKKKRVPIVEEVTVVLECSSCKDQWREQMTEAQLTAMGYPENRRLTRRKCPNCSRFTRPAIVRLLGTRAARTTKTTDTEK